MNMFGVSWERIENKIQRFGLVFGWDSTIPGRYHWCLKTHWAIQVYCAASLVWTNQHGRMRLWWILCETIKRKSQELLLLLTLPYQNSDFQIDSFSPRFCMWQIKKNDQGFDCREICFHRSRLEYSRLQMYLLLASEGIYVINWKAHLVQNLVWFNGKKTWCAWKRTPKKVLPT